MSVRDILETKGANVVTIRSDTTVADAVGRMRAENIGALVVSSDGRTVEGVISERDVVRGLADEGEGLLAATVETLMTTPIRTCSPDDAVETVMLEMTEHRARHFPVVDGELLVGIVSIGDVVKNRLAEIKLEKQVLRESYIAGK